MQNKSVIFRVLSLTNLVLLGFVFVAQAHTAAIHHRLDTACEELQKIIDNSGNGFRNVRYNEKVTNANSYIYSTDLKFQELSKPAVMIGDIALYSGKMVKAPFYQAFMVLKDLETAKTQYFSNLVNIRSCLQEAAWDNTTPPGYVSYNKFLAHDQVNNSEVTVSLALLKRSEDAYYIALNAVSDKAMSAAGGNQNPSTGSTNTQLSIPAKTIDVCQFIKILSSAAKNNFDALKGEEIPKYSSDYFTIEKKYQAKIAFSEFEHPQIQRSIYKNTLDYYTATMTFEDSGMVPFVMKQTINSIKGCTNLNLTPDSSPSKDLYDFRIEKQAHPDGFKYDYLVRLQWGEAFVTNSPNLFIKFVPIRQD